VFIDVLCGPLSIPPDSPAIPPPAKDTLCGVRNILSLMLLKKLALLVALLKFFCASNSPV